MTGTVDRLMAKARSQPRIALSYIHGGNLRQEFAVAVQDFILRDAFGPQRIGAEIVCTGPYIPENRNQCCQRFLDTDCEWLWFLDIDIRFPPDILDRLLAAADPRERPIVAALYFNQINDTPPGTWWPTWTEERDGGSTAVVSHVTLGEVRALTACGMGCTVIHRSVIEKLAGLGDPEDPWHWFGNDLIDGKRAGEDVTFCTRARAAGFPVHGLCVVVDHIKTSAVTWSTWTGQFHDGKLVVDAPLP